MPEKFPAFLFSNTVQLFKFTLLHFRLPIQSSFQKNLFHHGDG